MRQFIALTFNSSFKEELVHIIDSLKEEGIKGKYYDPDNLHMTLAFFGETNRQDEIMEIIQSIPFPEITITTNRIGHFKKIYWVGVKENPELDAYVNTLRNTLKQHDIPFDDKPFYPHITILRKAEEGDRTLQEVSTKDIKVELLQAHYLEEGLKYLPYKEQDVLEAINEIYKQKRHVTIAIDGRCGSGKTTLANKLKAYFDCHIFHMDDFYLQEYQRTQERYNEPGGNVDRERFKKEVLDPLKNQQDVLYRPIECSTMSISEGTVYPYKPINIIEGSYSCHPELIDAYDITVFLDIDEPLRYKRIEERNGKE
ncbi:RNA 2',3'-cyclic phosphodiesterase, partial [Catenibacterium mitsuokai]|uniref:RNA 2',3'-cyclic phosphodiesterase n=1 Tax=Catenibacterium mitsuokai TaxID=100886 RepID=UPI001C0098BA